MSAKTISYVPTERELAPRVSKAKRRNSNDARCLSPDAGNKSLYLRPHLRHKYTPPYNIPQISNTMPTAAGRYQAPNIS